MELLGVLYPACHACNRPHIVHIYKGELVLFDHESVQGIFDKHCRISIVITQLYLQADPLKYVCFAV